MFRITRKKGFHMVFANGWTVSVQFGPGNYGGNYDADWGECEKTDNLESETAEIAAWDKDRNWYQFPEDGQVKGYVKADDVLKFINEIASK